MRNARFALCLALAVTSGLCAAAAPPDAGARHVFIIQRDMAPLADTLGFHKAFEAYLRRLPPGDRVSIYGFELSNVYELMDGRAAELHWPPKGYRFTNPSGNTTPVKDLLAILVNWNLRNTNVVLVTTGRDRVMVECMNPEAAKEWLRANIRPDRIATLQRPLVLGSQVFSIDKYKPLGELIRFFRNEKVTLTAVQLWKVAGGDLFRNDDWQTSSFFPGDMRYVNHTLNEQDELMDSFAYTALTALTEASGGKVYIDFTNFKGLFETADF